MEGYEESVEIIEIPGDKSDEKLTQENIKLFWNYVEKINWLFANTRPDLVVHVLELIKNRTMQD